jgi:hypothetical protein
MRYLQTYETKYFDKKPLISAFNNYFLKNNYNTEIRVSSAVFIRNIPYNWLLYVDIHSKKDYINIIFSDRHFFCDMITFLKDKLKSYNIYYNQIGLLPSMYVNPDEAKHDDITIEINKKHINTIIEILNNMEKFEDFDTYFKTKKYNI